MAAAEAAGQDAGGVRCEPLFDGTPAAMDERARFEGLSAANFTPGNLARALLNGVARELHGAYRQAVALGAGERTTLVGSGNGLRLNPVLRRELARLFGRPPVIGSFREEAAVGAPSARRWPRASTRRSARIAQRSSATNIPAEAGASFHTNDRVLLPGILSQTLRPNIQAASSASASAASRYSRFRVTTSGRDHSAARLRPWHSPDSFQSDRSIGTASSCRVEPCSHVFGCGQQIGCECSLAETVSWTSRRNTQVPSLT